MTAAPTLPPSLRRKQPPPQAAQPAAQPQPQLPPSLTKKGLPPPKEPEKPFLKTVEENVAEAPYILKGMAAGISGTPGNILDILHLQPKGILPGEQEQRKQEFSALERLEKGQQSLADLFTLAEDEILPRYSRAGTTGELHQTLERAGIPAPKTLTGRFAQRAGEFVGPGVSAKVAAGAAGAGQALEEMGAPPLVQAFGEIITSLKLGKSTRPISSASPEVERELQRLREMGYSERDITLARGALEERGYLTKAAKYTQRAAQQFSETLKNIKSNVENIIEDAFPGLKEEGPQAFKKAAVELFDRTDDVAREVIVKKPKIYVEAVDQAVNEMKRSLANSSAKNEAIDMLERSKERANQRNMRYEVTNTPTKEIETGIDKNTIKLTDKNLKTPAGSISYYADPMRPGTITIGFFHVPHQLKHTANSYLLLDELVKANPGKSIYTGTLLAEGKKFLDKLFGKNLSRQGNLIGPDEIARIHEKTASIIEKLKPATAPGDFYTNFYKELNAVGNWGNPKQKEAAFGIVKDAIKKTLRAQGPKGVAAANALEEANKSWIKYLNAEDVSDVIKRATTADGLDLKRLNSLLKTPSNREAFIKGVGEKQLHNIERLGELSVSIADFEKKMRGGLSKELVESGKLFGLAKSIITGDWKTVKAIGASEFGSRLATKMLIDPKYQNIGLKMIDAAKHERWTVVKSLTTALEKQLSRDERKAKPEKNR